MRSWTLKYWPPSPPWTKKKKKKKDLTTMRIQRIHREPTNIISSSCRKISRGGGENDMSGNTVKVTVCTNTWLHQIRIMASEEKAATAIINLNFKTLQQMHCSLTSHTFLVYVHVHMLGRHVWLHCANNRRHRRQSHSQMKTVDGY